MMRVDSFLGGVDYIKNIAKKMCYSADSGIGIFLFSQKIASKAKNGRKNKIILRMMPPLKMKPVTLLRVKAQVQYSATEKLIKKSEIIK